jgi:hypothetical protein
MSANTAGRHRRGRAKRALARRHHPGSFLGQIDDVSSLRGRQLAAQPGQEDGPRPEYGFVHRSWPHTSGRRPTELRSAVQLTGPAAHPPLTVTAISRPATVTGLAPKAERILSATWTAPPRSVCGRIMRNSSPPHRPATSPARSSLDSRRANSQSTRSPLWCRQPE